MFEGQVNWTDQAQVTGQRALPELFAGGDEIETAFSLVFESMLGPSDDLFSDSGASNNRLDASADDVFSEMRNFRVQQGATSFGAPFGAYTLTARNSTNETAPGFSAAPIYGSSMDRLMYKANGTQVGAVQSQAPGVGVPGAYNRVQPGEDSGLASGLVGNDATHSNLNGTFNKSQLSDWMDAHALSRSSHHCAMYCRLGMEAAGLNTGDRPQSGDAGDYGPFLMRHGAQTVPPDSYSPQVGEVVVFKKTDQHPNGHIEMYDGQHWVSDFMQHGFSPYRDAASTPPFTIYRLS